MLRAKASQILNEIHAAKALCRQLESEEPEEVLQGRVDFGCAGEPREKVEELDRERTRLGNQLRESDQEKGGLLKERELKSNAVARLKRELAGSRTEHEEARNQWSEFYPEEEAQYAPVSEDLQQARLKWMQLGRARPRHQGG